MTLTILKLEIRRVVRDRVRLFFTAIMPAFFYVIFGAAQSYGSIKVAHGNVAMMIMVAMAAYGAVAATASLGAATAIERATGWGRQLGLTPLGDGQYVAIKSALAVVVAIIPITIVSVIGASTDVEATPKAWVLSISILIGGSVLFALYGLVLGQLVRGEAALGAVSGSLVVLSFLGNLFFPLSGGWLTFARFTPLYGYATLARYPVSDGWVVSSDGDPVHEALWMPLTNVAVWLVILAVAATLLVRRSRARQ